MIMMMMLRMILKGWPSLCLARSSFLSFSCLLVVIAVHLYGRIIMAPIQFCHPSYLKRVHFCTIVSASQLRVMKHHPPTRFYSPPPFLYRKMQFLYLNSRYLGIFAGFLPVKTSNINRFGNSFHCWIAFGKLYNIAAQSFSRHKLRCMKIIIETF